MPAIFRDIINHSAADNWGWLGSQLTSPSRIALAAPGEPQRFPGGGVKITVQPGDNPIHSSGERNELLWALNKNSDEDGNSGTLYYAISLYLPSDWQRPAGWCIPLQLHGPAGLPSCAAPPAFALDLSNPKFPGHYCLNQNGGDVNGVIIRTATDLGPHLYDTWVDFIFQVRWAMDSTGYTAVWTRSDPFAPPALVQTISGKPTLYGSAGVAYPHYWKRGLYRNAESFTNTLYASPFARASTFEDAAQAAFG